MDNNAQIQNKEEISFLDMFTVLLRYWKLITGITLASIILVVVGYFLYLPTKYKNALTEVQSQGIMQMEIVKKARDYVSQKLDGFILRPDIIYDSLYKAGMKEFKYKGGKVSLNSEKKNSVMYLINLFWIQNLDLNGNIYIPIGKEYNKILNVKKPENDGSVIEVTFKDKDPDMIKIFLETVFKLSTASVEENLRINAQLMVNNYERLMNLPKISESAQLMLEKDFDTYTYLKNFLDGKESVVRLVSGPVLVEILASEPLYKNQYFKISIIIVFAGFFLSVILAFALNAIREIKNNEEAMNKIRDALGNSDSK